MIYRRAFLRELCGDSLNESIATPFPLEFDGKRWDVATGGQALVLVAIHEGEGPAWPARASAPNVAAAVPAKYPPPHSVNFERLRDWCASTPPCNDCDGTGWIERDTTDDGDPEDVIACPVCERGYRRGFAPLLSAYVQRALLWRYLRPLSQPATVHVLIKGERDAVCVRHPNDEWRVYCMPAIRQQVATADSEDEEPFT